ncbi:hypothetical protein AB0H37_05800 [Actinomadura sp. NPDC023710]|uniref:hypothetical protein n=1 Tax=Actinomadura sp. NPDC023710 TaxID=3158219 RepID=UPI0033CA6925
MARFVIHGTTSITSHELPICETDEGQQQGQLPFVLPGWQLRLAIADEWADDDFPFFIEAVPDAHLATEEAVDRLQRQLFLMLSFVAGREIGLAVTAGLNAADQVVWGQWSSPRTGTGQWRWCPDHLVNDALPELAQGFSKLATDTTMEKVVDRAINLYLAANGTQPLDVRIPVAASGLELLAWAVLLAQRWLTTDGMSRLSVAAYRQRLLLRWGDIPIDVPDTFAALEGRRASLRSQPDPAGPEVIAAIRNGLVHPPKQLTDLEWPTVDEMAQAWRLGMNYLELVIMRLLGYEGHYLPRLQIVDRWVTDTAVVPWAR